MGKKLKFKPEVTRIKLNPEQAVLSCCNAIARGATLGTEDNPSQCDDGNVWSCVQGGDSHGSMTSS